MKASLEISMYPLSQQNYDQPIEAFIHRLQQYQNLDVRVNMMSTQVFGEYEELMAALTQEIKTSFEHEPATIMVMKLLNLDRSEGNNQDAAV